ncbi:hypothetical protein ACFLYU_02735 [Candidatus Dependentiae bacterium]
MHAKKSIKTLLIVSLLASSIGITSETRAGIGDILAPVIAITGLTAIGTGLAALQTYFSYQRGKKQYAMLRDFYDGTLTYEDLNKAARNHYYDQCSASSTSVSSDYPIIWLEKDATSNKNLLAWVFFMPKLTSLSKDLAIVLNYLRNLEQFQAERKEYNEKHREQSYRDDRIALEKEKVDLQRQQQGRR